MNIKRSILLRVRIAFLLTVVFVLAVVYRLVHVQMIEGDKWRKKAEEYSLDYKKIKATRGSIYSANNDLLATSLPFYRLAFDPSLVDDETFTSKIDSLSHLLSNFFRDHSSDYYKKKISEARQSRSRYMVINRDLVNYQQKQMMNTWPIFRKGQMQGGVIFHKVDERHRPFRTLAQRTIGYINEDNVGAGVERSFNDYLAGRDGEGLFQKVAGGNWKPVNASSDVRPEDGYDIHTTIDVNLQDVAQNALLRALMRYEAAYGTVVLMEVKTGEIKAISNLQRTASGRYAESYNYAVQGTNDPGSTFKLASMLALLEAGKVDLSDTVDTGEGSIDFYNRTLTDVKRGGYGKITVQEVFEKSSNVGIAKLVTEHFGENPQEFVDIIKKTGYGQPLDFQLMGEGVPYIKDTDDESWSGTTLPWMSVGYETSVTPLQTLALYNAVANDGRMIQPILVKSINKANQPVKTFEAKVLNKQIASDETLEKLRLILEGVVENGTAKNVKNEYFKIAGKTGTAQKLIDGRYRTQRYYASFAGYFPADEPLYSCIVVIDDPKGWNRYGGDVSAPVFKEIADMIYSQNLAIHDSFQADLLANEGTFPVIRAGKFDELNKLCNELGISNHLGDEDVDWVRSQVDNNAIIWKKNYGSNELVPNVQGMTVRDAVYLLENSGLKVNISGSGRVQNQSLRPGVRISKGQTISLDLG
ncbi:penicillin-binding protein [Roseivirga pacifica]|uniref:penicillin-binding protein n=1 Tax=Roseivirga pacifica TaxID=1267423 RepID=UPI002095685F|nr:penicillin-binding protein [Roseivirga pacifica]MCO6358259.1 PASTA domain-containing protein [Roseivirga pacifica]MCO6366277.1 PASTA domain-containing protein [Roseivirga pacifica]MCO6369172.1 PASTA domain-containing protein [Roseivirga pacifica]MCO6373990.1 PASTA domain-containing protein [Roseivirga pacifica]MCO6378366.1 PASTA domain-containing protein [Roseivirga pacifica]